MQKISMTTEALIAAVLAKGLGFVLKVVFCDSAAARCVTA